MSTEFEPCHSCGVPMLGKSQRCANCGRRRSMGGSGFLWTIIKLSILVWCANYAWEHRDKIRDFVEKFTESNFSSSSSITVNSTRSDLPNSKTIAKELRNWIRGNFAQSSPQGSRLRASWSEEANRGGQRHLPAELISVEFTDDSGIGSLGRTDRLAVPFTGQMIHNGTDYRVVGLATLRTDVDPPALYEVRISSVVELGRRR